MTSDEIGRTKDFFNRRQTGKHGPISPVQRYIYELTCARIPKTQHRTFALDLGCHRGRYTKYLANTFGKVWGVDFAEEALKTAERADNIEYICLDVETGRSKLRNTVPLLDLVIGIAIFEMVRRPDELASTLHDLVRPGGKIFLLIPNRR